MHTILRHFRPSSLLILLFYSCVAAKKKQCGGCRDARLQVPAPGHSRLCTRSQIVAHVVVTERRRQNFAFLLKMQVVANAIGYHRKKVTRCLLLLTVTDHSITCTYVSNFWIELCLQYYVHN